jgi:hypothetical protein
MKSSGGVGWLVMVANAHQLRYIFMLKVIEQVDTLLIIQEITS